MLKGRVVGLVEALTCKVRFTGVDTGNLKRCSTCLALLGFNLGDDDALPYPPGLKDRTFEGGCVYLCTGSDDMMSQ